MENATDALKMAFAVFVFVIALSTVFSLMTKTKEVADTVLWYSDKTNYYDWAEENTDNGRTVGEDVVISALYTIVEEKLYIQIKDGTTTTTFAPSILPVEVEKRQKYINDNLNSGSNTYKERVMELTTGGVFRTAEDGTKITIQPGTTKAYVIFEKQ
jgi:hypothetical protein